MLAPYLFAFVPSENVNSFTNKSPLDESLEYLILLNPFSSLNANPPTDSKAIPYFLEIFSNSVILSVEITNLEDNDGELHIENRFFSKIYPLQEGVNEIHCTGLSDRTTYNVEVIVKDTIISKTNFKTTIEKEMTLNRW